MSPRLEFPPYRSRFPWWGADLQTIRSTVLGTPPVLDGSAEERLEFATRDGSGDVLLAALNRPAVGGERPLVILLHGLTGCETSRYVLASARRLLALGYPVMRLNLRGSGPSRRRCRGQYHAGRSEDLHAVIGQLDGRLAGRGLLLAGFSLGGNIMLKYLGEAGPLAPVLGAVSVSAPIDLKATQLRLTTWRNRLYHDYLLRHMKLEAAAPISDLSEAEQATLARLRTIFDFDDRIIAPRNGFAGDDDYYARSAALRFLDRIRVPTLLIHARNDPWIPAERYAAFDWRSNPRLMLLMSRAGGHLGFHGRDRGAAWHDLCIAEFFGRLAG